uniref:Uncharacterized protein n=1 Tax=Arundo donax TaxID=35708 RepID=A0A0A9G4S4_ARUDO
MDFSLTPASLLRGDLGGSLPFGAD